MPETAVLIAASLLCVFGPLVARAKRSRSASTSPEAHDGAGVDDDGRRAAPSRPPAPSSPAVAALRGIGYQPERHRPTSDVRSSRSKPIAGRMSFSATKSRA